MCGRFALHAHPEVVALQFGLDTPAAFRPRYNVCPGMEVLAIREDKPGVRCAVGLRWGLVPHWAKDASIGNKLANARGEGVEDRPAFREAFLGGRCLVPASGYYEWQTAGRAKQPWFVRPSDAALFGLAGISSLWHGPQGPVRTVALVTTTPNALAARIHERMPLIIAPEDYAAWLDPRNADSRVLNALLRPYAAERMGAHPVSPRVNTPEHDEPGLIEPLAGGPAQRELL